MKVMFQPKVAALPISPTLVPGLFPTLRFTFGNFLWEKNRRSPSFLSSTFASNPSALSCPLRQTLHRRKFQIFKAMKSGYFPWSGQGNLWLLFSNFFLSKKKSFTFCNPLWHNHRSFSSPGQNAIHFISGLKTNIFPSMMGAKPPLFLLCLLNPREFWSFL